MGARENGRERDSGGVTEGKAGKGKMARRKMKGKDMGWTPGFSSQIRQCMCTLKLLHRMCSIGSCRLYFIIFVLSLLGEVGERASGVVAYDV